MNNIPAPMILDANSHPVLQVYDPIANEFVAIETDMLGDIGDIKDILSGQASITLTPTVSIQPEVDVGNWPAVQDVANAVAENLLDDILEVVDKIEGYSDLMKDYLNAIANAPLMPALAEQKTEDDLDNGIIAFDAAIYYIEIYNLDEVNEGVFTVNGIEILIPARKTFRAYVGGTPYHEVEVNGSEVFIISRYV